MTHYNWLQRVLLAMCALFVVACSGGGGPDDFLPDADISLPDGGLGDGSMDDDGGTDSDGGMDSDGGTNSDGGMQADAGDAEDGGDQDGGDPTLELESLEIAPGEITLASGTQGALTATGIYSDGSTQDVTSRVVWSSSDEAVATVSDAEDEEGIVSAVAAGEATITGMLDGVSGTASVVVTNATLESILVEPGNSKMAAGTTQAFTATGRFSDDSVQDLTTQVTWESDAEAVATIDADGMASAVAEGSATISASFDDVEGQTMLTVTAATLEHIEVSPANAVMAVDTTQQFVAIGTFSDASTQDLTDQATWASDTESVATISNDAGSKGLASALEVGSAEISAGLNGVVGTASLTVTDATLEEIEVTPDSPSIAVGTTQQFMATGLFSDGSSHDLTDQATWSSDDEEVATVSNTAGSEGLATGQSQGTATVTASFDGVQGSAMLTVTGANLESIVVTPQDASFAAGTKTQYTATGIFSDDNEQDLTDQVTWTSDDEAVVTVSNGELNAGLVTAVAAGSTFVNAEMDGVKGTTPATVTDATLESIVVEPADAGIAAGTTLQYTATGVFNDGSEQDLTKSVAWSATPGDVASISNVPDQKGLATGESEGTATIKATLDDIEGSTSLTVTSATLESIVVEPADPTLAAGTDLQFTATGVYSDDSEQDLTGDVTWSSSNTDVATISNVPFSRGEASGVAEGETTISASLDGVDGTTLLTVTDATLASIVVTPDEASIEAGDRQQFVATGVFSDESEQDLTTQVDWSTDDGFVAFINNSGEATGVSEGETQVSASLDSETGTAELTVTGGGTPGP